MLTPWLSDTMDYMKYRNICFVTVVVAMFYRKGFIGEKGNNCPVALLILSGAGILHGVA